VLSLQYYTFHSRQPTIRPVFRKTHIDLRGRWLLPIYNGTIYLQYPSRGHAWWLGVEGVTETYIPDAAEPQGHRRHV
jgi:hypothetical protein